MRIKTATLLLTLVLAALITLKSASAKDMSARDSRPHHVVQITPYAWAADMKGRVSPFRRTPTIGIKKPFPEIWDNLNLAGFLNIWARYDNFILTGDLMYVSITDSKTVGPLPPSSLPIPPGTTLNASADTRQLTASLLGGYRLMDNGRFSFDALAGLNYWHVENRLALRAGAASLVHKESFHWLDPLIGARAFMRVTPALSLQAQANLGGFNMGSKSSWSALATINYTLNDSLTLIAGYKAMDVDYRDKGHRYDVRLSGPIIGATWKF